MNVHFFKINEVCQCCIFKGYKFLGLLVLGTYVIRNDAHQQMNGQESCGTYIQWSITQPLKSHWISSNEVDETGAYYTEWSKLERKTPIQYTNRYIWHLENGGIPLNYQGILSMRLPMLEERCYFNLSHLPASFSLEDIFWPSSISAEKILPKMLPNYMDPGKQGILI